MFPYATQISPAFATKSAKMGENNPEGYGKTRRELRIYGSTQRTAQEYTSLARTYDEVMQPQSVMHEVKLSDYYEEILK